MSESVTMFICFGSGTECWNCGGHTKALDPDTGEPGPFEGDDRFCCEECCAEANELWEREERQRQQWFACCSECGFDNQEHDDGCSKKDLTL